MKTYLLKDPNNVFTAAQKSAEILRAGKVIIYPTDTLYGLGADALSDDAVATIYAIKGREEGKPVHCIVADMVMAAEYAEADDIARRLAARFFPGPLTLVLKKRKGIETGIARGIGTIGIRVPDHPFCLALARAFGGPVTTTSANKSGEAPERSVEKVLAQLGDPAGLIALTIDEGELPERLPSTVVDVSGDRPLILREGAIPVSEIWDELQMKY